MTSISRTWPRPDVGYARLDGGGAPEPHPRGHSTAVGLQRLDGDAGLQLRPGGFDPAVSAYGPGSLLWRAYRRHFATRVQDPVVVPLAGGGAVAIAPYVGYRGFPVRRPYWRGVYVYHPDGRLEDLTPEEAMQRPSSRARAACIRSGSRARSPTRTLVATGTP